MGQAPDQVNGGRVDLLQQVLGLLHQGFKSGISAFLFKLIKTQGDGRFKLGLQNFYLPAMLPTHLVMGSFKLKRRYL